MSLPSVKGAVLIHFGISLLIFIVLAALMRWIWYPGALFSIDGGWQGLKIIAPIDLVLGPALTLCFYRPWKKNVRFDMAVIATVQIAALSYGVFAVYQQRTAAIVFAEHRFETLSLSEYRQASRELKENDVQVKSLSEFSTGLPVVLYASPFSGEEYGNYLADIMNGLPELRERSDRYMAIGDARNEIVEYRVDRQKDGTTIELSASSKPNETDSVSAEIYTLRARYGDGTIEFDPGTFKWIDIKRDVKNE